MYIKKLFPYYKRNMALAFPIILSQAGQIAVSLADTLMVGWLGTTELASVAFATSVYMIVFIFGLGFSIGQTPHVGKAFGKKQWRKIGVLFQNALLLNTVLSIILSVFVFLLYPLFYHLNQPENVVNTAMPYFNWLLASTVPVLLFFTCRQFAEGVGNTKIAMWITLAGDAVNIILNYLLIFGKFGIPALGVEGAGIATFISRVFMAFAFMFAVFKHPALKRFTRYFSGKNFHIPVLKKLTVTGLPVSGQLIVEVLAFSLSAIMIGWIDEANMAAHQVAHQMVSAAFMVGLGVASACTIRISHQFGSGHYNASRMAASASLHIITVFTAITAISFIIFRYRIPALFSDDPEVIIVAARIFIIAGIFQFFDGWQTVGLAALRGLADVTFAMYIAFISYLVIALPIGYLFGFVWNFGSVGIWMGLCVGLMAASAAYRLRFLFFMKKYPHMPLYGRTGKIR